MDKISELSDDLLVKILSYLPTQVAASTMILSKRWQFLWLWLTKLEFGCTSSEFERLKRFLLRNFPLHRAPIIESFSLLLPGLDIDPEEVKLWVLFAVSRAVSELDIFLSLDHGEDIFDILPGSLYTCQSLVTLKLYGICMYVPHMGCLPSLKTLELVDVTYENKDSLRWLLSNCPVLEDLSVSGFPRFGKLIVRVPSLQRLLLEITDRIDEFVIDTPSLEYLKLDVSVNHQYYWIKNMPKLKEALLDVSISLFVKLIGSIPSVKRLTLCLPFRNISEAVFDDGFVLYKLKHLKLCLCTSHFLYVLVQLLKVSPNLRVLELFKIDEHGEIYPYEWNQPSTVPECLLSSLETLKWSVYDARKCFEQITSKHRIIAWNTMILGYAHHCYSQISLNLFSQMCNQNVKSDHVTFTAIRTACSHTDLVQEGLKLLNSMEPVYKIQPQIEHY